MEGPCLAGQAAAISTVDSEGLGKMAEGTEQEMEGVQLEIECILRKGEVRRVNVLGSPIDQSRGPEDTLLPQVRLADRRVRAPGTSRSGNGFCRFLCNGH